jgi:hypothetical protein
MDAISGIPAIAKVPVDPALYLDSNHFDLQHVQNDVGITRQLPASSSLSTEGKEEVGLTGRLASLSIREGARVDNDVYNFWGNALRMAHEKLKAPDGLLDGAGGKVTFESPSSDVMIEKLSPKMAPDDPLTKQMASAVTEMRIVSWETGLMSAIVSMGSKLSESVSKILNPQ